MAEKQFEVFVGNIGMVCATDSKEEARKVFAHYVALSQQGSGRAAREGVQLFESGDLTNEYWPRSLKNAAQGATKVVEAFIQGRKAREGSRPDYKAGARYETDGSSLVQWGSVIARKVNGSIEITDAGWRTKTTMAMLNAVLYRAAMNVSIYQKSHQWFLSTPDGVRPWSGKAVVKLDGGSVLGNRKPRSRGNGQIAFDVYLGRKVIDTVFYSASAKVTNDEVKRSLVGHDGYDPSIRVVRRRGSRKNPKQYRYPSPRRRLASHVYAPKGGKAYDLSERWPISGQAPRQLEAMKKMRSEENPSSLSNRSPWFVNVYNTYQEYGGPEEGGWWYNVGIPTGESYVRRRKDSATELAIKLRKKYEPKERSRYRDDDDVEVWVEDHRPRRYPQSRPHYENNGRGKRRNPLTRSEAANLLKLAKVNLAFAKDREGSMDPMRWKYIGKARGLAEAVEIHGPKAAKRVSAKVMGRTIPYSKSSMPNGLSCLKNLHTKAEQDRAVRLIHRYYRSGIEALHQRSKEKAAHAYGALAAIRRLAKMEKPVAQRVANFASFRMDCLRSAAKGQGRYRTKVVAK
jgi:hypothetical protein